MTRKEVQDELKVLSKTYTTRSEMSQALGEWLKGKCTDFEITQIMNDLTSYPEYSNLE